MFKVPFLIGCMMLLSPTLSAQEEDTPSAEELRPFRLKLQVYRYKNPVVENGDTMWCYLLPEVVCYGPLRFQTAAQRKKYNRLVYNVKRVLPIAQEVHDLVVKTQAVLDTLPDKKARKAYINLMEKEIKRKYTPEMKKLTYSQGKLLIKLVDRECNQSSYEIVKTFLGTTRATVYQVFAWTFRASLKKEYQPEDDDRLIERVVQQVETGQL